MKITVKSVFYDINSAITTTNLSMSYGYYSVRTRSSVGKSTYRMKQNMFSHFHVLIPDYQYQYK